jgi:hypothetical protein
MGSLGRFGWQPYGGVAPKSIETMMIPTAALAGNGSGE